MSKIGVYYMQLNYDDMGTDKRVTANGSQSRRARKSTNHKKNARTRIGNDNA